MRALSLKWLIFKLAFLYARVYGYFCYYRKKGRRKEIDDKFHYFLGERLNPKNRRKAVRHIFELRGSRKAMHYLIPLLDDRTIKKFFILEGFHHLDRVLKEGKGVVLLSGHLGNPHLGFCALRAMKYPLILVKGGASRQVKDRKFRYRETPEDTIFIFDKNLAASYQKRIVEILRSGKIIQYFGDTQEGRKKEKVSLLEKEMNFSTGMVHLAHQAKSAIVPCIHLYHRGKISVILKEPIEHNWEKGEEEYKRIISEFAELLETYILNSPEQYMGIYGPTVLSEYYSSHHDGNMTAGGA